MVKCIKVGSFTTQIILLKLNNKINEIDYFKTET